MEISMLQVECKSRIQFIIKSTVLLIILLSSFTSGKIVVQSSPLSLNIESEALWSYQLNDAIWGPSILDLDRDGELEIIVSDTRHIYCLNPSGETKWVYHDSGTIIGGLSFGDINADGKIDIVTNDYNRILCVNHAGKKLWNSEYSSTYNKPLVYDFNNDGLLEVIINHDYYNPYILNNKGKYIGSININYNTSWMYLHTSADPSVTDLNSDGSPEYLFITPEQTLHCLDFNFLELWQYTCGIGAVAPCYTDFEGDGYLEILMGSIGYSFYCLNNNGTLRWEYITDGTDPERRLSYYDPALGDLNNDGEMEVVMACNGYFYCLDKNGGELWRVNTTNLHPGLPVLCDLENDGFLETIVTGGYGIFIIGNNGTVLDVLDPETRYQGYISVVDINSDGTLEILAVTYEDKLVCLELSGSNSTTKWYTENGSIYRTGNFDRDGDDIDDLTETYRFKTNISNPDTDSDSLPDNWEVEYKLNPLVDDSLQDPDNDGYNNLEEYTKAHNPIRWDNWIRLYAGYLMPVWIVLSSLMIFFYIKTKPWGPKFVKFVQYVYHTSKDWLRRTAPIKEEADVNDLVREHKLKQEKV